MAQHRRNTIYGASPDMPILAELQTSQILANPYQPRTIIPPEHLKELTASIKERGQLDPIDVLVNEDEPGTYILIDGQCRLKAIAALGRSVALAVVRTAGDPHELSLIFNSQRASLHPLDQAASMAALIDRFEHTQEDLARIMSIPRATIAETLSLNKLPDDIKTDCRALDIGKTGLVALARLIDRPEEMRQLWDDLRAGNRLSTRELQRRQRGGAPSESVPADTPRELRPVARAMEASNRVLESLTKLNPAALAKHTDKLAELKSLHQRIGKLITKLASESKKLAAPAEEDEAFEAEEAELPPANDQVTK